jgi:hypothetical protein
MKVCPTERQRSKFQSQAVLSNKDPGKSEALVSLKNVGILEHTVLVVVFWSITQCSLVGNYFYPKHGGDLSL